MIKIKITSLCVITIIYLLIFPLKIKMLVPIHMSFILPILFFFNQFKFNYNEYKQLFLLLCFFYIVLFLVLTLSLLHQTYDIGFVRYIIFQILYFVSAVYLVKKYDLPSSKLIDYILIAIFIDFLIAIIFKLSPDLKSIIEYPFFISETNAEIYNSNFNVKFMGLGGKLFLGGVIAGYGVILSIYMYLKEKKFIYLASFIVSFLYGFILSRSIVVSLLLVVLLITFYFIYLVKKGNLSKSLMKLIVAFNLFLFFLSLALFLFKDYSIFMQWAFEIINKVAFGEGDSKSLDGLRNFYDNFVTDESMLLLGNGIWHYSSDMLGLDWVVDVGYLRVMYSFGLFMLIIYLAYNLCVFLYAYACTSTILQKLLVVILFLYFLILSVKGFINLSVILPLISIAFMNDRNLGEVNSSVGIVR